MSTYKTTHLGLHSWAGTDQVSRLEFNENFATLDGALGNYRRQIDTATKDAKGIYTVVNYKRGDGTLYMKSTLSGGTTPNYTTDTWRFYDASGATVIKTITWTLTYDTDGNVVDSVPAVS